MIEVEAPIYVEAPNGIPLQHLKMPKVFLAGGITGCPDWQAELVELLKGQLCVVLNPRRKHFDVSDSSVSSEQIHWEYHALRTADIISFWFCAETVQPITLFELGSALARLRQPDGSRLVIGVHPDYPRKLDVDIQCRLEVGHIWVKDSLESLASTIKGEIGPVVLSR